MQSVVPECADVGNGRSGRCAGTPTCRIRSAARSVSTHRSAVPSSTNEIRSTKPGDSQMAEAFIIDAVRKPRGIGKVGKGALAHRSEEHTSELQSLMRISYDVFCLKQKKITDTHG